MSVRASLKADTAEMFSLWPVAFAKFAIPPIMLVLVEEEGFYKFLPANTADRLCQSCSNHHEI